jgi:hypothetical protein
VKVEYLSKTPLGFAPNAKVTKVTGDFYFKQDLNVVFYEGAWSFNQFAIMRKHFFNQLKKR